MTNQLATAPAMQPIVPVSETAAILNMVERAARDSSVDVDKLKQLLEMKTKIEERAAQRAFDLAMTNAQSEMHAVVADKENAHTKSKYASYFALDKAIRPAYTGQGLYLTFNQGDVVGDGVLRVACRVGHSEGHSRDYHLDMSADGLSAGNKAVMSKTHAVGSAISYGRRYLLQMIFNLAIGGEEDDDGNAAGGGHVSDDQAIHLQSLIEETDSDLTKFLAYFRVSDLGLIPASKYLMAAKMLESKRKKVTAE